MTTTATQNNLATASVSIEIVGDPYFVTWTHDEKVSEGLEKELFQTVKRYMTVRENGKEYCPVHIKVRVDSPVESTTSVDEFEAWQIIS